MAECRALWNRWVSLAAGVYLMVIAGPVFSFGSISNAVQQQLDATEHQKQLISTAGNVGLWTNVVGGLVFDSFGARPTMLAGALLAACGYACMYLALVQRWHPLAAAAAWAVVGHGSGWLYISTLFANVKNFLPAERGFVVGTMSCFFGVSATIMIAVLDGCIGGSIATDGTCVNGFLGGSVTGYIGFLAVVVSVVGIVGALLTHVEERTSTAGDDRANLRFNLLLAGVLALVAFICGSNIYALTMSPSLRTWANFVLFALLAPFLALPFAAGPAQSGNGSNTEPEASKDLMDEGRSPFVPKEVPEKAKEDQVDEGGTSLMPKEVPEKAPVMCVLPMMEGMGPSEVVCTKRFWALWFVFGVTVGTYIMTLNNMVSIAASRDVGALAGHMCVVLATSSDTFSRFVSGFVVGKGLPPTLLLACGPILMCSGQLALIFGGSAIPLYIACVPLGLSDGIMWTLGPLLTGKAFGLRSSGRNFGLIVLSAATFALLLLLGLEPTVYSAHLQPGESVCHGAGCFGLTHGVTAGLNVSAVLTAALLHLWQRAADAKVTSDGDTREVQRAQGK
mmetsp:Transcript_111208/g.309712  ORF Transcript_111208/g.309712 Transcript_111208/m.309712 type:complete len:564 (+) Transcript_111208:109-1800(+)|eukprot:CAMPEP_0179025252 /NCGR_PEP_ID=MMETSP0796-20121207/7884_1 /TAXON_ID=73915 /ORGANISM="Pyrodinium bahamense, Strain pbaha01" /LENGTH=563 /DNA_ID=CAMNT_0020721257 /DNA_START=85 /DNA_END=1776 /DNA_ORIENTATION=+